MKFFNSCVAYFHIVIAAHLFGTINSTPIFEKLVSGRTKRASNRNCEDFGFNDWTSWGPCFKIMGQYIQSRWRTRRIPYSFKGQNCQKNWHEKICDPLDIENVIGSEVNRKVQRCDLTSWTSWSECYLYMRTMERERHRFPYFSKNGKLKCSEIQATVLVEFEECRNDCGWTSWTACYRYGTEKSPSWERYRENKSVMHPYMLCPGRWADFQDCEFCEWSSWRPWSSCYEMSGHQERKRERSRVSSDSRRGKKCVQMNDHHAEEYEVCPSKHHVDIGSSKGQHIVTTQPTVTEKNFQLYTPEATYSRWR
ncbi:uncharacterized protein LOC120341054 [Styela clava]|uniref:A disintegrin and metalloproteinase with thrombospondin motifs adt-1-like n=1 Tax=Styela clava TaxID=7725 RepID=UPI00193A1FD9|nr:A disintegrin and metalloproteinase with thrombospondin motifs adt-1-like [Styela clava]